MPFCFTAELANLGLSNREKKSSTNNKHFIHFSHYWLPHNLLVAKLVAAPKEIVPHFTPNCKLFVFFSFCMY